MEIMLRNMTKLKIQSTRKNEKGIALVFTLVMLSLLMILAMSFALDSMFSQKAAYNSASSSSSGFMGQAQLNQVLLLMKNDQANFDVNRLYSKDISYGTGSPVEDTDMLVDRLPVAGVLKGDPDNPTDSDKNDKVFDADANGTYDDPKVNWNYVKNADGKIIGRTAFVVIPKEKIPLNSLISKTVDESGGGATGPEVYDEKRIGKNVSEINIRKVMYEMNAGDSAATYTITPAMANKFNWDTFSGGLFTGTWASYSKIFGSSVLNLGDSDDEEKFKQNFINSFELDSTNDKEAFWADLNNDATADDNELYKRFNLLRDDWDMSEAMSSGYVRRILLLTSTGTEPNNEMESWKDEDSLSYNDDTLKYSKGLPWLACFGYKDDGTFYTSDDLVKIKGTFTDAATDAENIFNRRCQIAANLKDYCDSDDIPTSNVLPSTWVSTADDVWYTGNEKTPYINKVGVKVESTLSSVVDGWGDTVATVRVSVKPYVGLIDIYRNKYPDDVYVTVKGKVSIQVSFNGGAYSDYPDFDIKSDPITISSTTNWAVVNGGHSSFVGGTISDYADKSSAPSATAPTAKVRVTNVTITKVVLHDSSNAGYDYVRTLNLSPSGSDFVAFSTSDTPGTKYCWLGFEVNDPRQNLNAGDWIKLTPQEALLASSTFAVTDADECKPNSSNTNTFIGTEPGRIAPDTVNADLYDLETSDDPANRSLSTSYIRNAPMESPWELGFIHRGKMWQTLNLKKYDASKAIKTFTLGSAPVRHYIPGGGLYSAGDANILDQIKMTKSAKSPEKINIAAQKEEIHKALFANIMKGSTINGTMTVASMADTGTALTLTDANIATIMSLFTSASSSNRTRACVADTLAGFTGGTKDAEQEELIGKMINLTKISGQKGSGSYTVIVLAQAINDIGGVGAPDIKVYRVPADGGTAIEVPCQIGTFDTAGGNTDWKKNAYGDEVAGEQKIIAEVNCSPGEAVVKSIKYID